MLPKSHRVQLGSSRTRIVEYRLSKKPGVRNSFKKTFLMEMTVDDERKTAVVRYIHLQP
jgi:hypothetical protein